MKRLSVFVLLALFVAQQVFAATPVLVQVKNDLDWTPYIYGNASGFASGNTLVDQLPNPVGANNLLVELIAVDDTTSYPTISDSLGLTWTRVATCKDATNGEDVLIYSASVGATGGVDTVTTTIHATTIYTGMPALAEFAYAGSADGAAVCGTGSTTTITAASKTPSQTGDLAVQFSWNDFLSGITTGACEGVHYTEGSQTNITWSKFIDGSTWCFGAQWGVYNSTTALSPTFSISTAGYNTAAVFFNPASSGTPAPSGIRITAEQQLVYSTNSGFNSTSQKTYFPCASPANLMVVNWAGPGPSTTYDLTAVTDSDGNTWSANHAVVGDSHGDTVVHTYSVSNASVSTDQYVTLALKKASNDSALLYCIAGAATSALDLAATNTGDQTSVGDLTLVTITPSVPNDLALVTGSQDFNTTRSFTGTGQIYQGCWWSSEPINGDGCAANNPWGGYYASSTSAITWVASMQDAGTAAGYWSAESDAYKAASASSQTPPPIWVIQP